jgi:hypothetical protein
MSSRRRASRSCSQATCFEEAERVLHVGTLHQLAGGLGDCDVGGGGPTSESADYVAWEADQAGRAICSI